MLRKSLRRSVAALVKRGRSTCETDETDKQVRATDLVHLQRVFRGRLIRRNQGLLPVASMLRQVVQLRAEQAGFRRLFRILLIGVFFGTVFRQERDVSSALSVRSSLLSTLQDVGVCQSVRWPNDTLACAIGLFDHLYDNHPGLNADGRSSFSQRHFGISSVSYAPTLADVAPITDTPCSAGSSSGSAEPSAEAAARVHGRARVQSRIERRTRR
jgi:hypothetical protein